MIKNYFKFLNENILIEQLDEYQKKVFHISNEFKNILSSFGSYKIRDIFLNLRNGYLKKDLIDDPIDYLDCDADGNISFLKSKYFVSDIDGFKNPRRMKMKITKILPLIFKEEYLKSNVKQTDVEQFINAWNVLFKGYSSIRIEELRGDDILRAYNYTGELTNDFGSSCANFKQNSNLFGRFSEPTVEEFDIYTKNPENMGVVVAVQDNKIIGRRLFHQGVQLKDNKFYIKGNFYTIWNNYYGKSGKDSIYDKMIKDYLEKKYDAKEKYSIYNNLKYGGFLIHLETRFRKYCPFDGMYVCFEKNWLTDKITEYESGLKWHDTYKAKCPNYLVKERLDGIEI